MQMLEDVEVSKIKPSIVWAKYSAEVQQLQWDKWLFNSKLDIFKSITMGDDLTSEAAKATVFKISFFNRKIRREGYFGRYK